MVHYIRRNAVFAMRDADGKITGAEIVGTAPSRRFRGMAKGSCRNFGDFWLTVQPHRHPLQCQFAILVESAINALSAASLPQLFKSTADVLCALPEWLAAARCRTVICGNDANETGEMAAECLASNPYRLPLKHSVELAAAEKQFDTLLETLTHLTRNNLILPFCFRQKNNNSSLPYRRMCCPYSRLFALEGSEIKLHD